MTNDEISTGSENTLFYSLIIPSTFDIRASSFPLMFPLAKSLLRHYITAAHARAEIEACISRYRGRRFFGITFDRSFAEGRASRHCNRQSDYRKHREHCASGGQPGLPIHQAQ